MPSNSILLAEMPSANTLSFKTGTTPTERMSIDENGLIAIKDSAGANPFPYGTTKQIEIYNNATDNTGTNTNDYLTSFTYGVNNSASLTQAVNKIGIGTYLHQNGSFNGTSETYLTLVGNQIQVRGGDATSSYLNAYGLQVLTDNWAESGSTPNYLNGIYARAQNTKSLPVTNMYATDSYAVRSGTGSINGFQIGILAGTLNSNTTGSSGWLFSSYLSSTNETGCTVANAFLGSANYVSNYGTIAQNYYGGYINPHNYSGGQVNANLYGLEINAVNDGNIVGTSYALSLRTSGTGTYNNGGSSTKWGVYTTGETNNQFAGQTKFLNGITLGTDTSVLSDYEEGTWTPTFIASTTNPSSITYGFQQGKYTRIGDVVHFTCLVSSTTNGISGDGVGEIYVDGLPFVASNAVITGFHSCSMGYNWVRDTSGTPPPQPRAAKVKSNDNYLVFWDDVPGRIYYTTGGWTMWIIWYVSGSYSV